MPRHIQAIRVDYTSNPHIDGKRLEIEQVSFWIARLNESKPDPSYSVLACRTAYKDPNNCPLYFLRISMPSGKHIYAKELAIIGSE